MRRIVIGLALCLGACSSSKDGEEGSKARAGDGTMLSPYLAIGDTLAADEIDGLDKLAAQVITAAEGKDADAGVADLIQGAGRVGARDIATARTAYKKMSAGMIEWMKAHPDAQDGHMIVHCTMTFGGKGGVWVQKKGKIFNPYEGHMMLHCGDVVDWSDPVPQT